jgi:hypothetical protein
MSERIVHEDQETPADPRRRSLRRTRGLRFAVAASAMALSVFFGLGWLGFGPLQAPFADHGTRAVTLAGAPGRPGSRPLAGAHARLAGSKLVNGSRVLGTAEARRKSGGRHKRGHGQTTTAAPPSRRRRSITPRPGRRPGEPGRNQPSTPNAPVPSDANAPGAVTPPAPAVPTVTVPPLPVQTPQLPSVPVQVPQVPTVPVQVPKLPVAPPQTPSVPTTVLPKLP